MNPAQQLQHDAVGDGDLRARLADELRAVQPAIQRVAHLQAHQGLLTLLRDGPLPVKALAAQFELGRPAISEHLKVLRDAGLVDERREGTRHLFVVNPDGFSAVQQFLADFWTHHLGQFKDAVENPPDG